MLQFNKINLYIAAMSVAFFSASTIGKFVGTYLPLRFFSSEVTYYAGVIFNYCLTFGLVTAIFGLERDIITPEMFNTILLCVLFSSLAATHFEKKEKVKARMQQECNRVTSSDVINFFDVFSVSPSVRALPGSKNTPLRFLCQT